MSHIFSYKLTAILITAAMLGVALIFILQLSGNDTSNKNHSEREEVTIGLKGIVSLDISEAALPPGVPKEDVRAEILNVFDLPIELENAIGDDIALAAINLEPDGLQLKESAVFILAIHSERKFDPRVFHVNNSEVEELKDFSVSFNETQKLATITGTITHFSGLIASKDKSQETLDEFAERANEISEYFEQKAEQADTNREKAQFYRSLVDKAYEHIKEAPQRFGDKSRFDFMPGRNVFHESSALAEYGKAMEADFRERITHESDPNKKFDIFEEWVQNIGDTAKEWDNGFHDERLAPALGRNERLGHDLFGNTLPRRERSEENPDPDSYVYDPDIDAWVDYGFAVPALEKLDKEIASELNPQKRLELVKNRMEKTQWMERMAASGAIDERIVPPLGIDSYGFGWQGEFMREQSESLIKDFKKLVDSEQDPIKKRKLAEEYLDAVNWLKKIWKGGSLDESKRPDMFDWPLDIDDILKTPQVDLTKVCYFTNYLLCRNSFDLQGCIDACPLVDTACPPGTQPNSECKETDQTCVNYCFDIAIPHAEQCAKNSQCTSDEINKRLQEMETL